MRSALFSPEKSMTARPARDLDGDAVGDVCGSGDSEAALGEGRLKVLVDVVHRVTDINHNCSP